MKILEKYKISIFIINLLMFSLSLIGLENNKSDIVSSSSKAPPVINETPKPLNFFEENIFKMEGFEVENYKEQGSLIFIGKINEMQVYDVVYDINSGSTKLKMILIEKEPSLYYPVSYLFGNNNIIIHKSKIANYNKTNIISDMFKLSGTGNATYEKDYLITASGEVLILNDVYELINERLNEILPEKHKVLIGGGFNIFNFTFQSDVWRPSDPNCCPTGGTIFIALYLNKDNKWEIRREYYDPNKNQEINFLEWEMY